MDVTRTRQVLRDIVTDSEGDVERFEGQPFTGKVVAEYMGCQAAMIQALAKVVEQLLPAPEVTDNGVRFRLWSNKHAKWWAPDARGYTDNIAEAGLYTEAMALEHVRQSAYHGLLGRVTCMVAATAEVLRDQPIR